MRMRTLILVIILANGLFFLPMSSSAQQSGERLAKQALEECHKGRLARERATRLAHFQQGQILGERRWQRRREAPMPTLRCFAIWESCSASTENP